LTQWKDGQKSIIFIPLFIVRVTHSRAREETKEKRKGEICRKRENIERQRQEQRKRKKRNRKEKQNKGKEKYRTRK
jgi:hypothetical protein